MPMELSSAVRNTRFQLNILDSIVVSIPACHAGDPGSIPGREDLKHAARLAQSVERWPFKPVVVGSSPTVGAPNVTKSIWALLLSNVC